MFYDFRNARILDMTRGQALEILGFPPSAAPSLDELKRAQKRKALELHPDRGGDPSKLVNVNRAFDFLTDPKASGSYDYRNDSDGRVEQEEAFDASALFNAELQPVNNKKGFKQGWWHPGHNLAVSIPMRGLLGHTFSLLGGNPYGQAVRMKGYAAANKLGDDHPEGIIIHPSWWSLRDSFDDTLRTATKLIAYCKNAESIKTTVQRELSEIEQHHGVNIPSAISSKLIRDADKLAVRTYGVDLLRKNPKLMAFDGSIWEVRSFGVKKTSK